MKNKKIMALLLSVISTVFCFCVTACDQPPKDEPPQTAEYTVTVINDDQKGTVSGVTNGQTFEDGEAVSVSVIAKQGFKLESVKWDNEFVLITNPNGVYFTKTIEEDVVLKVNYSTVSEEPPAQPAQHVVSVVNDEQKGTISGVTNGQTFDDGASLTITVSAKENYKIHAVVFATETIQVTDQTQFSFTRTVLSDATLSVAYLPISYVFQIENDFTLGEITGIANGNSYEFSSTQNVTVTPKTQFGVRIKSVTFNGSPVAITDQNGFTFSVTIGKTNLLQVGYEWDAGWTPNA